MFGDKTVSNLLFFETKKFFISLCIIAILVFIPQINLTSYPQSTITSKFIVFIYSCIVLFGLSVLCIYKPKVKKLYLSNLDISLAILIIYITCNRYLLQSHYSFSIRFIELLGLIFLYVIFRTQSVKLFYGVLLAIIISGIIQAIYGNLQLLDYYPSNHSGFKLTGSFFNPGPYAGFLVSVFPIALGMYLFREKVINNLQLDLKNKSVAHINTFIKYTVQYIPLIGVISIILVIPATQSRASWLAVIVSSSLLLEFRYKILKKIFNHLSKLKRLVLVIGIVLIALVSLLGVYHFKKGSSDGRLFIWKVSTKIIGDNPFFGVGFDRFKAHYMNYQANYFAVNGETQEALVADNTYYAFNEMIQFVVENGIIGFLMLIAVFYVIFKLSISKENIYLIIIIKIALLSIAVFAFFSYPTEILPVKLIVIVLLAAMANLDQNTKVFFENFKLELPFNIIFKSIAIVVVLIISASSLIYIKRLNTSFKNWELALNSYQYGDYESAIKEYEIAYPELKRNGEFLMNYGKALSMYKQNKKAIKILEHAKKHLNTTITETALGDAYKNVELYNKAEANYKHAASMIPSRFYPLYLLAKLYDESGQKENALAMANTILEKEIKVPSTAVKEIQQEMKDIITEYKLFN
ncbi:O-antigen ligase family protein [Hyunsoonleella ulvae]|uniref:O-antigen ligase family protein n=1 Tax=Hyunsoonleella ulvae TaxID=2799948 RepID=UPI001939354E|nr:O-antigen ligase family protein [Hyunsoonleella ulvae]